MQSWSVQDAKSRFSEFLDACLLNGPQMVTRKGTETAVLVPLKEWESLQATTKLSLKQLLLTDQAKTDDLVIPPRGKTRQRNYKYPPTACKD